MEEDTIRLLHRALNLLEETNTRLNEIERLLEEHERTLPIQEIGKTEDVQKLLKCSRSTIDRRRKEQWCEGVHWWQEGGRPVFNLPLIKDWLINQNDPMAHQRTIEIWVKNLPSNQARNQRKRA